MTDCSMPTSDRQEIQHCPVQEVHVPRDSGSCQRPRLQLALEPFQISIFLLMYFFKTPFLVKCNAPVQNIKNKLSFCRQSGLAQALIHKISMQLGVHLSLY